MKLDGAICRTENLGRVEGVDFGRVYAMAVHVQACIMQDLDAIDKLWRPGEAHEHIRVSQVLGKQIAV